MTDSHELIRLNDEIAAHHVCLGAAVLRRNIAFERPA
jgi:hypothetical protein